MESAQREVQVHIAVEVQGRGQFRGPADAARLFFIQMATIKKNLRLFNGFPFLADSDQYSKKRDKLLKSVPAHDL